MGGREGTIQRFGVTLGSAALVVVVGACSGASPSPSTSLPASVSPVESAASTSPSAAASPIANSSPTSSSNIFALLPTLPPAGFDSTITCTGLIGATDPVAIVQLQGTVEGTGEVVLRDYVDPNNPRTACTFVASIVQLIDARHVVINVSAAGTFAVVDLPDVRFHFFQVPTPGLFLAVGPKLDQVLWMTSDPAGTATDTIHVSTGAGDHIIATLPNNNFGRCGSPDMDSKFAAYTPSGSHLFVLDQPLPDRNSLIVVEGETPVFSVVPPSAGWPFGGHPAMALWSPTSESLFYEQGGTVWKWAAGSAPQPFLPGVAWIQPTISADGSHLAYSVGILDGLHEVYLADIEHGGSPQKIGEGPRKAPVFVNSTQLWFKSEGDDHGCAGAEGEKPLIYNVVDGSEAPSIIDYVMWVWPSTSSNR